MSLAGSAMHAAPRLRLTEELRDTVSKSLSYWGEVADTTSPTVLYFTFTRWGVGVSVDTVFWQGHPDHCEPDAT